MATTTTRLGLTKPDLTDIVDIAQLNSNADKIDTNIGAYICTSTTRPSTPYTGQVIYETDSKLTWTYASGAWKLDTGIQPVVASSAARDAIFASPSQGNSVWRNDLGAVETYYAAYNSSTNPGGRTPAGWYAGQDGGLIPITPTSVQVGTGTASVSGTGVITYSGTAGIRLNGIFSNTYRSYKIVHIFDASTTTTIRFRFSTGGADNSSTVYWWGGNAGTSSGTSSIMSGAGIDWAPVDDAQASSNNYCVSEISNPFQNGLTRVTQQTSVWKGAFAGSNNGISYNAGTSFDGLIYYPTAGTISGTIQVFGYRY